MVEDIMRIGEAWGSVYPDLLHSQNCFNLVLLPVMELVFYILFCKLESDMNVCKTPLLKISEFIHINFKWCVLTPQN
jgi:hypothetical protein